MLKKLLVSFAFAMLWHSFMNNSADAGLRWMTEKSRLGYLQIGWLVLWI